MKTDILKQFTSLRNSLSAERTKLQARLTQIEAVLGASETSASAGVARFKAGKDLPQTAAPKKGGISAAGRARIVAAQKARWAKIKAAQAGNPAAAKPAATKPAAKKSVLSAAARAKIAAAVKARWAKAKAAGKKGL